MTPEPMIVQHDDRAIYHRRRWERTERSEICIADSFEHPNRCDWRCSHDREGCIRRTRNNSVGRDHVEIFVRPMRYKGCRQVHNAQVVICALFTTRNSLKLQGAAKGVFTRSQSSCHIAKVVLTLWHDSRQIPIACDAPSRPTSRGFLHWRFAYAGPGVRGAVIMGPASENLNMSRHSPAASVRCQFTSSTSGILNALVLAMNRAAEIDWSR